MRPGNNLFKTANKDQNKVIDQMTIKKKKIVYIIIHFYIYIVL